jgi:hypothetical protein
MFLGIDPHVLGVIYIGVTGPYVPGVIMLMGPYDPGV